MMGPLRVRRAGILYNPISGRGKAALLAEVAASALVSAGISVRVRTTLPTPDAVAYADFLTRADLLVLVGGDGTLLNVLPDLSRTRTPIYMLPAGTESLFAARFRMRPQPQSLLEAIGRGLIQEQFIAEMNGRPFFSMVSVGYDAEVVARLAAARTGTITHFSYAIPAIQAALTHRAPILDISADGRKVVSGRRGFLIAANSLGYALGIRFVPEANGESETLCARFFPYNYAPGFVLTCLRGIRPFRSVLPIPPPIRGREFEVRIADGPPALVQADGEFAGGTPLVIRGGMGQIRVLLGC